MIKQILPPLLFAALLVCNQPGYGQENDALKGTVTAWNNRDNNPSGVFIPEGSRVRLEQATAFLAAYLHPVPGRDELRLIQSTSPYEGIVVQRYEQWLQGIKVEHGGYTVTARQGLITSASGDFYNTSQADAGEKPALSSTEALEYALRDIGAKKYAWEQSADGIDYLPVAGRKPDATLVWIENKTSGLNDGKLLLAYKFVIHSITPFNIQIVYIDALNGNKLFRTSILYHNQGSGSSLYSSQVLIETSALPEGVFSLIDNLRGNGIYTYDSGNRDNLNTKQIISTSNLTWSGSEVDVHWGTERVYDYWKILHNRRSYNDLDSPIFNHVHYRPNPAVGYDNAAWIGNGAIFGDGRAPAPGGKGPFVSLDVCAHEIGHGICQTTADLIYERESGALNEGFSDIWAAAIEAWADPLEMDARSKERWLIGEELSSLPSRNMQNPKERMQPDTYLGEFWRPTTLGDCPDPNDTNDNCGVHYNSGVLNHWFYLLSAGGSGMNDNFNSYSLPGIGMDRAARIAYLTELTLTNNATYSNCMAASISAAKTLFGDCSTEFKNVVRAWYAVGLGDNQTGCDLTAIDDAQGLNKGIRAAHNPFRNTIVLRYYLSRPELVNISLTDAAGRVVYKTSATLSSGKGDYTLDLNNTSLSKGWYMLQLTTSRNVFGQKLVKD
jgi:bacillolysin